MFESPSDWEDRRERCSDDERPDPHEDDHITGFCADCHEHCTSVTQDDGIGSYEYWGSKGVHHEYVEVSPCCAAEVLETLYREPDNDV